ncbi:hypothetical protein N1851_007629 [Merluccius polli]|uniref:Uncharacterized protein n=1 Tax=Merluccius polli TaxID=89951 RepID=A0AA47N410_MERPO|nr:hypothetical protein N1851_007629 [Merluccius polli]
MCPQAFAMLLGAIYCLNFEYPRNMKYSFEFLQRVVMNIKPDQCSARIHGLRNKLLRYRMLVYYSNSGVDCNTGILVETCPYPVFIMIALAPLGHGVLNRHICPDITHRQPNQASSFTTTDEEDLDLNKTLIKRLGLLLLKLQCIFNVSNTCIDELVEELNFLSSSASGPVIKEIILSTLRKHSCTLEDSLISELVKDLCQLNPFSSALGVDGPLSTHYRRQQFMKEID